MSELVEKWRLAAAEWLDAQQAADLLRETKNDVFAEIKSKQFDASSEAERERLARISDEWKDFRNQLVAAEAHARRLKLRVTYEKMVFDAWRTEAANARSERSF